MAECVFPRHKRDYVLGGWSPGGWGWSGSAGAALGFSPVCGWGTLVVLIVLCPSGRPFQTGLVLNCLGIVWTLSCPPARPSCYPHLGNSQSASPTTPGSAVDDINFCPTHVQMFRLLFCTFVIRQWPDPPQVATDRREHHSRLLLLLWITAYDNMALPSWVKPCLSLFACFGPHQIFILPPTLARCEWYHTSLGFKL